MFCSNCGSEVADSAAFCASCGAQIDGSAVGAALGEPSQASQAVPAEDPLEQLSSFWAQSLEEFKTILNSHGISYQEERNPETGAICEIRLPSSLYELSVFPRNPGHRIEINEQYVAGIGLFDIGLSERKEVAVAREGETDGAEIGTREVPQSRALMHMLAYERKNDFIPVQWSMGLYPKVNLHKDLLAPTDCDPKVVGKMIFVHCMLLVQAYDEYCKALEMPFQELQKGCHIGIKEGKQKRSLFG